ncbi:MAG: GGDEF domain-containing protein [Acidobacteria bacterium]|nr:GGDEF domain-containing protein [Acidobacteriota bacterium]
MISLRRSIDEEEERQRARLLEEALACYGAAIAGIRVHALRACPPLAEGYTFSFAQLEQALAGPVEREALERSSVCLNDHLKRFGDEASRDYHAKADEIRDAVRLLAAATETFAARTGTGSKDFTRFANRIEWIAGVENLTELRRQLRQEVQSMRARMEQMALEDRETVERLECELAGVRQRLEAAETLASRDLLTHLANRRELERQVRLRISRKSTFCMILFDLTRFQSINDRYGELMGDTVLRDFASRLVHNIRVTDVGCRWGGDEFIVLLDCPIQEALIRSRQLHQRVCGRYAIGSERQEVRIEVAASMAVAEHHPGETAEELLTRAGSLFSNAA